MSRQHVRLLRLGKVGSAQDVVPPARAQHTQLLCAWVAGCHHRKRLRTTLVIRPAAANPEHRAQNGGVQNGGVGNGSLEVLAKLSQLASLNLKDCGVTGGDLCKLSTASVGPRPPDAHACMQASGDIMRSGVRVFRLLRVFSLLCSRARLTFTTPSLRAAAAAAAALH